MFNVLKCLKMKRPQHFIIIIFTQDELYLKEENLKYYFLIVPKQIQDQTV